MIKLKKHILFALAASLLLACFFSLTVSASDAYVDWELSEDGKTLVGNGKIYTRYENGNADITVNAYEVYKYYDTVEFETPTYELDATVCTRYPGEDIVWLDIYVNDETPVYVTQNGRLALDAFFDGSFSTVRINALGAEAVLGKDLLFALDLDGKATLEIDVRELEEAPRYDITAYDASDCFSLDYGAIYALGDKLYYVNYEKLDNSYFDADGNFSYRRGTVTLSELDSSLTQQVNTAVDSAKVRERSYTYENDGSLSVPMPVFWMIYSLLGFAAPIPIFIAGLVLANSKKRTGEKHWYSLSAIAALWLVLSVTVAVLLIL